MTGTFQIQGGEADGNGNPPPLGISDHSLFAMLWVVNCYFNYLRNSHLVKSPLATVHDDIWETLPL